MNRTIWTFFLTLLLAYGCSDASPDDGGNEDNDDTTPVVTAELYDFESAAPWFECPNADFPAEAISYSRDAVSELRCRKRWRKLRGPLKHTGSSGFLQANIPSASPYVSKPVCFKSPVVSVPAPCTRLRAALPPAAGSIGDVASSSTEVPSGSQPSVLPSFDPANPVNQPVKSFWKEARFWPE